MGLCALVALTWAIPVQNVQEESVVGGVSTLVTLEFPACHVVNQAGRGSQRRARKIQAKENI
jgi:hypothetical protein